MVFEETFGQEGHPYGYATKWEQGMSDTELRKYEEVVGRLGKKSGGETIADVVSQYLRTQEHDPEFVEMLVDRLIGRIVDGRLGNSPFQTPSERKQFRKEEEKDRAKYRTKIETIIREIEASVQE